MTEYDSPWKEALDAYFEAFMAFFFAEAHGAIDWSRGYETLDKELQQIVREAELGGRVADKLVRVWRTSGDEEWVLVHVEVQSQQETDFARRMYVYDYRLFDRYNRKVVSLAVLGDDRPGWRPDEYGYQLWGCTVHFRFPVVKLLDYATDWENLEADANPFAIVVMAHLKAQETAQNYLSRRDWKLRLVRQLYERGLERKDIRQSFRFIDWIMDLPETLTEEFWDELVELEKEQKMPFVTSGERIGEKKGMLKVIEPFLEFKFGAEGKMFLQELRDKADLDTLYRVVDVIKTAESVDQLRNLLPDNAAE